jgi:hypothetical protein
MADAGFAMLKTVVSNEPFTLVADLNPGVTSINQKIMMVRNYHQGKDPNTVWFKFMVCLPVCTKTFFYILCFLQVLNSTNFSKEFLLRTFLDAVPAKFVPVKVRFGNADVSDYYLQRALNSSTQSMKTVYSTVSSALRQ